VLRICQQARESLTRSDTANQADEPRRQVYLDYLQHLLWLDETADMIGKILFRPSREDQ